MAPKLRDVLKKQKGGMIGVTIDGKQRWFEEDDFMELFEKEGTKEVLIDAIKHGRDTTPKLPTLGISPKSDISATKEIKEDPGKSLSSIKSFSEAPEVSIPPKPTDEQLAKVEKTPLQEVEGKATTDPYGRKEEFEAITPKNFPVFEKRVREKVKQHLRKFDWLKTLHPKDAAKRDIQENEEEWFDEFAQSQGKRGMEYELLDDYKKDKNDEMRRFLYDWQQFYTKNKEAVYDYTNQKFFEGKRQRDELVLQAENQLDAKREEMNEIAKAEREEAEKYTPENRVKDMKALAKAKRNLTDAEQEQDKDEVAALTAEIKLLEERLGVTGITKKEESLTGIKNEDKMRAHLKSKGYSEEQIESTLKEYATRKG